MFMSSVMKEAVNRAAEVFGKGRDPQEIDIILDKACYSQMLAAAEKTGESVSDKLRQASHRHPDVMATSSDQGR